MRVAWIGAMCLVMWASVAMAAEQIVDYDSQIVVQQDGSLLVTETIQANVEAKKIRRGLYRDLPTSQRCMFGVDPQPVQILGTWVDGKKQPVWTEQRGTDIRAYIGQRNVMLENGLHTFRIQYRAERQVRRFEGHDEVSWSICGNNWPFRILKLTATLQFPDGVTIQSGKDRVLAYTGKEGDRGRDYRIEQPDKERIIYTATQPLFAGEGMTIVACTDPAPERVTAYAYPTWLDKLPLLVVWHGLSVVASLGGLCWFLYMCKGRNPMGDIIRAQRHPPADISPAMAQMVSEMALTPKRHGLVASIVSLATKGCLTIGKSGWGNTIQLDAREPDTPIELPPEEFALAKVIGGKLTLTQSQHIRVNRMLSEHTQSVREEVKRRQLYNTHWPLAVLASVAGCLGCVALVMLHPDQAIIQNTRKLWWYAFSINAVALLVFWAWIMYLFTGLRRLCLGQWKSMWISMIGVGFLSLFVIGAGAWALMSFSAILIPVWASIAMILYWFIPAIKCPSADGKQVMDQLEGLKLYLTLLDRETIAGAPDESASEFERLLPYAIALQCDKEWAKMMTSALSSSQLGGPRPEYHPYWLAPSIASGDMLSITTGLRHSLSRSIKTSSGSSGEGGSFGGDGSSGGGGGGGGGGF